MPAMAMPTIDVYKRQKSRQSNGPSPHILSYRLPESAYHRHCACPYPPYPDKDQMCIRDSACTLAVGCSSGGDDPIDDPKPTPTPTPTPKMCIRDSCMCGYTTGG